MRAVLGALSCPDEVPTIPTTGPPEVVPAVGSDGREATAAALYATADALVHADVPEVAEAVYDLAVDLDAVVTALGAAWFEAEPADRPLLVLRRLVRRAIDPEAPDLPPGTRTAAFPEPGGPPPPPTSPRRPDPVEGGSPGSGTPRPEVDPGRR